MNKLVPSLIVILLLSCSQVSKNGGTVIDLSKNSSTESVNPDFLLNDIAENISYVQLKK